MRNNKDEIRNFISNRILRNMAKPLIAVTLSFVIGAILMALAGYNPWTAFSALFDASFRNTRTFGNALVAASPLLFTGIAVAFAFKGSVFNIGAEGQFLAGAIAASWVGQFCDGLPRFIVILIVLIVGFLAGGLWGFIPGYLKAKHGVSEVITTIMFNYIAMRLIGFLVKGPLQEAGSTSPQTAKIADSAILPFLIPKTQLHIGYLIGVILAVIIGVILFKTYWGYEVRAVGLSPVASAYNGINVNKTVISTLAISGALAGLGGAVQMTGVAYRLYQGFSPGYGYTAIAVSMLVNNNPIGVIFSSFLFGVLNCGATAMQRTANVSAVFVNVFQGVIILAIAASAISDKVEKKRVIKNLDKNKQSSELKSKHVSELKG